MSELTYTSGVTDQVFDMESELSWGAALGLRSRAWDYSLGYRGLTMPARKAREVTVSMNILDPSGLDAFMRATDADIRMNRPGLITGLAESDAAWTQHAAIVKTDPQAHHRATDASIDLTIALLDGVWRRRMDVQHFWSDALQPGLDLDYPHDYPHDYTPTTRNATAENPMLTPMPFEMVIFGPVEHPSITIGANRYELDMSIPSGGHVTVTSMEGKRTILLTAENGDVTDVFSKGVRGDGEGNGTYIFEQIPPGSNTVQWNGFGFDLTVIEEVSEPQWV